MICTTHHDACACREAEHAAEIARLTAEVERLRKNAERLGPHAKWLRQCAGEIASKGHYGWGNTCTAAADAIDAAIKDVAFDAYRYADAMMAQREKKGGEK